VSVWSRDLKGKPCDSSRDCGGYPCVDDICAVPYDVQQKQFMLCFVKKLSLQERFYFSSLLGINGTSSDDSFVDAMLAYFSKTPDCVAPANFSPYRTIYNVAYLALAGVSPVDVNCEKKCLSRFGCLPCVGSSSVYTPSTQETCTSISSCNWRSCTGLTSDQCDQACDQYGDHFCGHCNEIGDCSAIHKDTQGQTIASKGQCEALEGCLLPNGSVILVPESQCLQIGSCNIASKTTKSECENTVRCNDDVLINTAVSPPIVRNNML